METRQRVIAEPGAGGKPCWASPAACDEPRLEHMERAGGGRLGSEETPGTGQSISSGRPRKDEYPPWAIYSICHPQTCIRPDPTG